MVLPSKAARTGVGEFFLDGGGEVDACDAVGAEFFDGAFGELAAKAGLIDAAAFDARGARRVDAFDDLDSEFLSQCAEPTVDEIIIPRQ